MKHNFHSNRGMYAEALVNNTIKYYLDHDVAMFKKAFVPTSFYTDNLYTRGRILDKSDVDYYGIYHGKYIGFEVKETKEEHFLLSQIKEHQYEILKNIYKHGGISFLLLNFSNNENCVWVIFFQQLLELINQKVKHISQNNIQKIAHKVPIQYPGIIDWIPCIENYAAE